MESLTASQIIGGNTGYKRIQSDYYPTPADVTKALLDFIAIPKGSVIWEPACGEGHMVEVMESYGYKVIATDIKNGVDFLNTQTRDCDWIITNPPFSHSEQFIKQCIESGKPFALLLKSQYWHAKKRLKLFRHYKPEYILPLTWRPDFLFKERGRGASLMDVIWCVWGSEKTDETKYIPIERPVK